MDNRGSLRVGPPSDRTAPAAMNFVGAWGPVASWLLHCADPLGSNLNPPHTLLSAPQLQRLLLKADAHKVLPSVLRHYPFPSDDAKLEQLRQQANARRVEAAALSAMLKHHAGEIIEAAAGLPVALVKGPMFASLYPSGLRPFGDVDLLVAPSALPQLASILKAHGFRREKAASDRTRLEHVWVHCKDNVLMVEVHTNLVHSARLRTVYSLTYDDLEGKADSPGTLLAIAVMHGAMHFFAWLRHIVDICQAARSLTTTVEESHFESLTDRTSTRLAAIVGLTLAYRLFAEERCLEIARVAGDPRDFRFARLLIEGAVASATMGGRIVYNTWRRFVFRELLRHSTLTMLPPECGQIHEEPDHERLRGLL